MTAARAYRRCPHGFLVEARLCTDPSCPAWDGKRGAPAERRSTVRRCAGQNGRTQRVLARIGTDWAPYPYEGDSRERDRDAGCLSRLARQGDVDRRLHEGRVQYRRTP